MLKQTRNALIYSDLAIFLLDTRDGINYNDVALYNWLTMHSMRIKEDEQKIKTARRERQQRNVDGPSMADFEDAVIVEEPEKAQGGPPMVEEEQRELDPLEKQRLQNKLDYKER